MQKCSVQKPPYALHEVAYRSIKNSGGNHWADRPGSQDEAPIDIHMKRFFDTLSLTKFFPKEGRVLELGCGSAVFLRWLFEQDYTSYSFGAGVDVSPTAIELAMEQSSKYDFDLRVHDHAARDLAFDTNQFDLVVDGHCLHCVTNKATRRDFIDNAARLLAPGGLFVVATMCTPMNWRALRANYSKSKVINRIHYHPFGSAGDYKDVIEVDGTHYVPQRYFGHWKDLLSELTKSAFELCLFEYRGLEVESDLCSTLHVALRKAC